MRVFSFGGGVQSTAALVLAAQGDLEVDAFLFANVGEDSENPDTLCYVRDVAMPYATNHGLHIEELHYRRRDGSIQTLYGKLTTPNSRTIGIPVYLGDRGVPARRNCTTDFKIKRVASWCYQHGARKTKPATVMLGISLDEFQRMRSESGFAYTRLGYPLIERRISRAECHRIITAAGLPTPPKSSCWFCPYHSVSAWRRLHSEHPALFAKAVDLEVMLTDRAKVIHAHRKNYQGERERIWFSSTHKPLPMLIGSADQPTLISDYDACDSGYCFA